ncbi:hypothetical protein [Bradyrhizobium ganzhouense]|uniref:hypothetical protein n=1 Tax=Bradyrhizobium ganzhouense TaxID=1179767 RepID=UPI003CF79289
MGAVQYGGMDRLCACCIIGRLRIRFVHDGHGLYLLSFGCWLVVLDRATSIVAACFGELFGNAERVGAGAHLDPHIRRIDAGAMLQRNEVVDRLQAWCRNAGN